VRDGTLKPEDLVSRCWKVFCLAGAGLTLGAYLFHFWVISLFSLDIPFWDEWDVFPLPLEVGSEAILNWLFLPHNQHWIVPTRAQFLFAYYLNGWDLATLQCLNFFIFGLLVFSVGWGLSTGIRQENGWEERIHHLIVPAPLLLFLVSPIAYENHDWAFQSQFHFALLFSWWAVYFLFSGQGHQVAGTLMLILAVLSQSIGIAGSAAVLVILVISRFLGWRAYAGSRRQAFLSIVPTILIVSGVIVLWRRSVSRIMPDLEMAGPLQADFWTFLLNLISYGWGINHPSWGSGLLLLLLTVGALMVLILQNSASTYRWLLLAWSGMILGALTAIALGRAGLGVASAQTPRYAEVTTMLIPIVVVAWAQVTEKLSRQQLLIMGSWLVLLLLFANNWSFTKYGARYLIRMQGIDCLKSKLQQQVDDIYCPELFPGPLGPRVERARILKLSFVEMWGLGVPGETGRHSRNKNPDSQAAPEQESVR